MNGKQLIDAIERLVYGATTQERINLMAELAARRIETRIAAALERLADEKTPESVSDQGSDDDDEPHQCARCGLWEAYGASSLCATCRPDDDEEGEEAEMAEANAFWRWADARLDQQRRERQSRGRRDG
jgi:hypothetical protein